MTDRPNILFILTDQHRKRSLGCYGSQICSTPNLDRIASEGVLFENAYTTCPVCTPARASVQTGLYPFHHGMQTNIFQHGCMIHELADTPTLLSRRLQQRGYRPGYTGKWHLGYGKKAFEDPYYQDHYLDIDSHLDDIEYPDFYRTGSSLPTDLGYAGDDFPGHGGGGHAYPQYREYLRENGLEHELVKGPGGAEIVSPVESAMAYYLTQRSIHYLDEMQKGTDPFFFSLNYWGPHGPTYVPTQYLDLYRGTPIPPWPSFDADQTHKPSIHNVKRGHQPWSTFEARLRYYYGFVSFIDAQIGRLLAYMDKNGLLENTWILFSADHGDSMGIHAGLGDKSFYMYEDTTSIPLLIRPPGGADGKRESRFASTVDLYSTVLDLAGSPPEERERDGRSLRPLVEGAPPSDWPDSVVTEASGLAHCLFTQRMIRRGRYKYVFNCGDLDELYDLESDPYELRNLAVEPDSAPLLEEMRQALADWMKEKGDGLLGQFRALSRA